MPFPNLPASKSGLEQCESILDKYSRWRSLDIPEPENFPSPREVLSDLEALRTALAHLSDTDGQEYTRGYEDGEERGYEDGEEVGFSLGREDAQQEIKSAIAYVKNDKLKEEVENIFRECFL